MKFVRFCLNRVLQFTETQIMKIMQDEQNKSFQVPFTFDGFKIDRLTASLQHFQVLLNTQNGTFTEKYTTESDCAKDDRLQG